MCFSLFRPLWFYSVLSVWLVFGITGPKPIVTVTCFWGSFRERFPCKSMTGVSKIAIYAYIYIYMAVFGVSILGAWNLFVVWGVTLPGWKFLFSNGTYTRSVLSCWIFQPWELLHGGFEDIVPLFCFCSCRFGMNSDLQLTKWMSFNWIFLSTIFLSEGLFLLSSGDDLFWWHRHGHHRWLRKVPRSSGADASRSIIHPASRWASRQWLGMTRRTCCFKDFLIF